ncbi:MAG: malate dehydrogenase [Methanobacteriaceae archaeon]|nr:malate dehydrogenase [Methanobacteriaceae archaeon]
MKVTVLGGSGRVGKAAAFCLAEEDLVDEMVLLSREKSLDKIKGESLDMNDAMAARDIKITIKASCDLKDMHDSRVVVLSAGVPRQEGMSRQDLSRTNSRIVAHYAKQIAKYAPDSIILVVTNPVDVMTYIALKKSGFSKNKVMGLGNHLDSLRLKNLISKHFEVHVSEIHTRVIGEHGDNMVPLMSSTAIGGILIKNFQHSKGFNIDEIVEKVKNAGQYVISMKGSTEYGPAFAISNIVNIILKDEKKILTVSSYLDGEIENVHDVCLGVPVKLGIDGIERIIPIKMDEKEKEAFLKAVNVVKASTQEALSFLQENK